MSRKLKLILYAVCILGVFILGAMTLSGYHQATKASERRAEKLSRDAADDTNTTEITNTTAEVTNLTAEAGAVTNAALTNTFVVKASQPDVSVEVAGTSTLGYTRMVTYGLGFVLFFIGFAALIAYDVSHFLGSRA